MNRRRMKHAVVLAALVALSPFPAAAKEHRQSEGTGTVVVVHGLEGFLADVYLDGSSTPALSGFEYQRVTDPLALPAGSHRADLRAAGDPPTAPPALSGSFTVTAGQTITVAALLSAEGQPTWIAFADDAPPVDAGASILRFRHFAAADPVTFVLDGQPVLEDVPNVADDANVLPVKTTPGGHMVEVLDAATSNVVVPEQPVELADQSNETLYLTGRSAAGTMDLLQQRTGAQPSVEVLSAQTTPSQIAGGNSGLADPRRDAGAGVPVPTIAFVFGLAAAIALVARTTWPARRRGA